MTQVEKSLKQSFSNIATYLELEGNTRQNKGPLFEANIRSFLKKVEDSYRLLIKILPDAVRGPLTSIGINTTMCELYTALKYSNFAIFKSFLNIFQQVMLSLTAIISIQDKMIEEQKKRITELEILLGDLEKHASTLESNHRHIFMNTRRD
jgi:hypothetical protein